MKQKVASMPNFGFKFGKPTTSDLVAMLRSKRLHIKDLPH